MTLQDLKDLAKCYMIDVEECGIESFLESIVTDINSKVKFMEDKMFKLEVQLKEYKEIEQWMERNSNQSLYDWYNREEN